MRGEVKLEGIDQMIDKMKKDEEKEREIIEDVRNIQGIERMI